MHNYFQNIIDMFMGSEYPDSVNAAFYTWLLNRKNNERKGEALKQAWESMQNVSYKDTGRSFSQVEARIRPKTVVRRVRLWRIAAISAAAVAAIAIIYPFVSHTGRENFFVEQYVPTSKLRTLTLPDGSKAILNSQSTLIYPEVFKGGERSVILIGEACFKVVPDKKHPFVVKSSDVSTTVLGTEFNIRAYPEEPIVSTSVLSGTVRVEYGSGRGVRILTANRRLDYNRITKNAQIASSSTEDVTAWQRGELVFRDTSIEDIIKVLGRKYPYAFVYEKEKISKDTYTFRFKDGVPLEEVLDIIVKVVGNMKYSIKDGGTVQLTVL